MAGGGVAQGAGEGLVCVGDSIISAERSWGFLLAGAGHWPLVRHSARGARSWQVLDQLPHLRGHRFVVGALTVGANDLLFDWNAERYAANLRAILQVMNSTCDQVLLQSFPQSFRAFPGSSPQRRAAVVVADEMIRAAVSDIGGAIVDGSDLKGRLLCPDRVHPSVLGHLVLADRAAGILGLDRRPSAGVTAARNDHSRIRYAAASARATVREALARGRKSASTR